MRMEVKVGRNEVVLRMKIEERLIHLLMGR